MRDWRVLFQYFNPDAAGPHFGFTTVHAETAEQAEIELRSARHRDQNLEVVQVVEANEFVTGYTYADVKAQRTPLDIDAERRREATAQIVALANAEAAGTLAGTFGSGWTGIVDRFLEESTLALQAAGILPDRGAGR